MSRLISLTDESKKFGTGMTDFLTFGNELLEIHFEPTYAKGTKFVFYLQSTCKVSGTILLKKNDAPDAKLTIVLEKDKMLDFYNYARDYVSFDDVTTAFSLDLSISFVTKRYTWFYDQQHMLFRYLNDTTPRTQSFTKLEELDQFDPFGKEANALLREYVDEFKILQRHYPQKVNLNIPKMDLMKLEEISDCWNECLRQNEEEQMLFSPTDTIKYMLGIDEEESFTECLQFEMDLS